MTPRLMQRPTEAHVFVACADRVANDFLIVFGHGEFNRDVERNEVDAAQAGFPHDIGNLLHRSETNSQAVRLPLRSLLDDEILPFPGMQPLEGHVNASGLECFGDAPHGSRVFLPGEVNADRARNDDVELGLVA